MMYVFAALMLLVSACAPSSEMIQHGNQKVLLTQTRNGWDDNAVLVTPCKNTLHNGTCDPEGDTRIVIMSGKLPTLVGAGIQGVAMVGSAALVADGLKKSKSTTNVTGSQNQTNKNVPVFESPGSVVK